MSTVRTARPADAAATGRGTGRPSGGPGKTGAQAPRASAGERAVGAIIRFGHAPLHAFPRASTLSYHVILTCVLLLLGIGVLMVLSASTITSLRAGLSPYSQFLSQARFALIGLVGMVVAARLKVGFYKAIAPYFLAATVLLQCLVFVPGMGIAEGGNRNWIRLPGIGTMQPSELVKLGLCLYLGAVLAPRIGRLTHWKAIVWPGLVVAGVAIGLVLLGHDMGTVLVMVAIVAGIYWFAGLGVRWFLGAGAVGVLAVVGLVLASPSRITRVLAFLGLGADDPTGTGFQTQHGLWALGTGGLSGVGLGASREKWVPLPAAHNDFIFAIIGEELGLLGGLLVIALFVLLGWAMLRLAQRHPDPFVGLATGGITMWILAQAVINIAVVVGALPVIGIPLPLVSAGGSALVSTLAAMGVVLAFARDEPDARRAFRARPGVVQRSMAVLRRGGRAHGSSRATRTGRTARTTRPTRSTRSTQRTRRTGGSSA